MDVNAAMMLFRVRSILLDVLPVGTIIMEDEGRLGGDGDSTASDSGQSVGVALTVPAHHGVEALGHFYGAGMLVGIERHIDVAPSLERHTVTIDMVSNQAVVLNGQEIEVLAHQDGRTHVER